MWRLLLPLLLSFASRCSAVPCDANWMEFDGGCYQFFKSPGTAIEAEATCNSENAYLTEISSQEQEDFFYNTLVPPADKYLKIWNGLKQSGVFDEFMHPLMPGVVFRPYYSSGTSDSPDAKCAYMRRITGDGFWTIASKCDLILDGFVCKQGDIKTTTTTTTTTKKPTTTTKKPTPPPKIANPKKWIIDDKLGTQIHRSYHSALQTHHYTTDWTKTPANFAREGGPGYVVSVDRFPQIKATCPGLRKVGIWRSGTISYIGNSPPAGYQLKESFYCATSQFACGANYLLRQLNKEGGGDIFYASNENEAHKQLIGYEPGTYKTLWYPQTPCWIWKNREDTWYNIVKANGGMIWGGYHKKALVHYYTLQRHLVPGGFGQNAGPGYIVGQNLYDGYFKEQCPELFPARIWHGNNDKSEHITWIGREGRNPPAVVRNAKQEELRFYCAPRANYCNANFLLRRMDKTNNGPISFFYPGKEEEAWEQLRGDKPGVWKNSKWSEEVCYIWHRW